jgi:N-acetylglucosaminyl-diphospho-decaprenol L-rhamnosyltransferase
VPVTAPLDALSIVVVTWLSADDVGPLLASLAGSLAAGAELVVVENASGDATPVIVRAAAPAAAVIENPENRGFAAAANQGLAASRGAFVLFLNPDTVVAPDTLPRALAHLAADPSIGALGCRTLGEDGAPQPTVDRFHTVGGLVREALASRRRGPRGRVPAATEDVDWVYGSFLLCRRAALEAVGGFDEAYEMYGEDLDLCHRLRAAGWRVVYLAEATIVHRGNRSGARRYGAHRDLEVLKGTLRFFRRRRGAGAERAFRLAAGASFALKALAGAVRALGPGGGAGAERARRYARMARLCATGDPAAAAERDRAAAPPPAGAAAGPGCAPGRRLG